MTLGVVAIMFGAVADLVGRNRQLLEQTLERLHRVEDSIRADTAADGISKRPDKQLRDGTNG